MDVLHDRPAIPSDGSYTNARSRKIGENRVISDPSHCNALLHVESCFVS